jgi:hypothetical protein
MGPKTTNQKKIQEKTNPYNKGKENGQSRKIFSL